MEFENELLVASWHSCTYHIRVNVYTSVRAGVVYLSVWAEELRLVPHLKPAPEQPLPVVTCLAPARTQGRDGQPAI